ncbi:hypothetical protein [Parasitella parasitica]|uniref:Sphingomyelin phosphodiesterase C-terminal domain-containing protein n=1 Tax=Parasitella parasitica TaxID=35722 RepID=A0A0B7N3N2_9FUNG|nr:hypothetical protein [Parasitella parasitica]
MKPSKDFFLLGEWTNSQLAQAQVPLSSWSVWTSKHPEIYKETPIYQRKQHGYFLHITDMHVDPDYVQGATVKSACHQLPDLYAEKKKKPDEPAILSGKYGTPGQRCDAPVLLAQETLDWISREWKDKLDFVVWTGDNAKHDWDKKRRRKRRHVYELNQRVTDMMLETFWVNDKIPIIPSFGNNDVFPHNQIGGPEIDGDLLMFYERMWRPWMPMHQRSMFRQGGYYVVQVAPRLNVLTLNSMYFYKKNKAVHNCLHPDSPAAIQLVWFEDQLKKARRENEKIYVIGHVPPSPRDYKGTCLTAYTRIATSYTDVIMGQFFAHLNMDHFLLFDGRQNAKSTPVVPALDYHLEEQQLPISIADQHGDDDDDDHAIFHTARNVEAYMGWLKNMYQDIELLDDDKSRDPTNIHPPLVVVQVSPSVLPIYHPSLRIYQYEVNPDDDKEDPDDGDDEDDDGEDEPLPHGTLLGYSQYFANLTKWNNLNTNKPLEYELEYSTKEAYGMEDLTVESYFELAKLMVENSIEGNKLWGTYQNHMLVKSQNFTSFFEDDDDKDDEDMLK